MFYPGIIHEFPTPWTSMRPPEDLAYRARNWFWYWQVRKASGLSNEQLDNLFFGADRSRIRHFERIQQTASSPDKVALVDGKTLLDVVHCYEEPGNCSARPYAQAKISFQSRLWEFLSRRDIEPSSYTEFIQQYVADKGWFRASNRDSGLLLMFLGPDEPAVEPGASTACSAMLHKLVEEATPDAIAVLIALFREALNGVQLERAILIKSALLGSVRFACERLSIPAPASWLIRKLVSDRIMSNVWISELDWRRETETPQVKGKFSRKRAKEFQSLVNWYVEGRSRTGTGDYGQLSIVPRSERIDWLENSRDVLNQAYLEVSELRRLHWERHDSPSAETRLHAERAAEEANAILKALSAPKSAPKRFYLEPPEFQIGHLPPPV